MSVYDYSSKICKSLGYVMPVWLDLAPYQTQVSGWLRFPIGQLTVDPQYGKIWTFIIIIKLIVVQSTQHSVCTGVNAL